MKNQLSLYQLLEVIIAKEEADQDGYYSEGRASKRNISLDAEPGTYYIKVSAGFSIDRSNNYSNGSSGEYRLNIDHQ